MSTGVQQSVIKGFNGSLNSGLDSVRTMKAIVMFLMVLMLSACGSPAPAPASNATLDPASDTAAGTVSAVGVNNPSDAAGVVDVPDAVLQPDYPVVVFLGDSLTAGFGLPVTEALPDQVAREMQALGVPITALNAGVSGDTTANGLARYNWSVRSARPERLPDILIVALGANDYLQGLDVDITRANLVAILDKAQADRIPVLLAGLAPRSPAASSQRDTAFAAIYPDLSEAYNVPLYPALLAGVRDSPALLQPDGLHPTAEGVRVMASNLAEFLAHELLQTTP